uniref:Putative transforming growth factor beta regulator n=1 Tax=Ixodes ricinus TaxID=34613 RepID=A0A0K8R4P6_IXORI
MKRSSFRHLVRYRSFSMVNMRLARLSARLLGPFWRTLRGKYLIVCGTPTSRSLESSETSSFMLGVSLALERSCPRGGLLLVMLLLWLRSVLDQHGERLLGISQAEHNMQYNR